MSNTNSIHRENSHQARKPLEKLASFRIRNPPNRIKPAAPCCWDLDNLATSRQLPTAPLRVVSESISAGQRNKRLARHFDE